MDKKVTQWMSDIRMREALDEFWVDCVYYWMWKYQEPAMRAALVKFLLGECGLG